MPLVGILHPVVHHARLPARPAFYEGLLGFRGRPATRHDPERLARSEGPAEAVAEAVILHDPMDPSSRIAAFHSPEGRADTAAVGLTPASARSP